MSNLSLAADNGLHWSRTAQFANAASAVYLFSARVVVSVLQLRFVDHYWGGSLSGLNALSNQVLLYMTLLELGLAQSAITFLYEPIVNGSHEHASSVVCSLRRDIRRLLIIGSIVAFPLLALYARSIHSPIPFWTTLSTLWLVGLTGVLQLAALHFQVYLNAAEKISRVNLVLGTGYLAKTAVGLPLAIAYHQYLLLPASIAALTIAELVTLKIAFHLSFPRFMPVAWRDTARSIRSRAKFVVIHKVAGLAYYQSDFIILSLTTALTTVTNYARFQYISAALLSLIGMVAGALTASVARHQLRNQQAARYRQYVLSQRGVAFIGTVLVLGYWFTARMLVTLIFGPSAGISQLSLALFGVALFLNIVKAVDDVFLAAKGRYEIGFWIPIVEVFLYLIAGFILSRRMGIPGILLASIATNLLVSVVCKGVVLSGPVFDSTPMRWFRDRALNIAWAAAMAAPLACVYLLTPSLFSHAAVLHFLAVNGIAFLYGVAGVRWLAAKFVTAPGVEA